MGSPDEAFQRRARAAAGGGNAAGPSALDGLVMDLAGPLALERQQVANETLGDVIRHLYRDGPPPSLPAAQQELDRAWQQLESLQREGRLRDGGSKLKLSLARKERYVQLLEEQQRQERLVQQEWAQHPQQHPQQQAQAQAQHPPAPAGPLLPGDDPARDPTSKAWLLNSLNATQQQAEAHGPGQQQAQGPGQRQSYVPHQSLKGSRTRDFSGLNSSPPGAPTAARGAAGHAAAGQSKRHQQLLGTSGPHQGATKQGQQAQQQRGQQQLGPDPAQICPQCGKRPGQGRTMERVQETDTGKEGWVCSSCLHAIPGVYERLPPPGAPRRQSTIGEIVRHKQQQGGKPALNLQPVGGNSFYGSSVGAKQPQSFALPGGVSMPAGRQQQQQQAAGGRGGGGKGRGGGKQGQGQGQGQQRRRRGGASDDEEYDPGDDVEAAANRAAQRRNGKARGGRGGAAAAGLGDSDSEYEALLGRPQPQRTRQPSQRGRGAGASQQPSEPVTIDLLSDEDHPPAAGAAGGDQPPAGAGQGAGQAAGVGTRSRPTRAASFRATSERFKGLKCLYPPQGGPGAVEVTALDLSRLDQDEFLNDTVIDFYLRWLQDQLPPEVASRCYFFNTFFFKKLMETSGGALTPDLEAYAKQLNLKDVRLQALRNHQKVKKWTKDVDLFSKDYIFVPVHEALHWSLMVVCHPGVAMEDLKGVDGQPLDRSGAAEVMYRQLPPGQPTPCILHLDSIKGSHSSVGMANKLRYYLQYEWDIKSRPEQPDSVPRRWAESHPGRVRSWSHTHDFPMRVMRVPKQDNHCDCGLFMCSYPEFFTYRLPPAISLRDISELMQHGQTNRDLFEGTDDCYPGLLTERWFPHSNPTNLRWDLRRLIVQEMARQNGLLDEVGRPLEGDPRAETVLEELQILESKLVADPYVRPAEYQRKAEENKRARQQALEKKRADQEAQAAQRRSRQAGAAKKGGQDAGDGPSRDLLAQAAERRLQAGSGGGVFGGIQEVANMPDSQDAWEEDPIGLNSRPAAPGLQDDSEIPFTQEAVTQEPDDEFEVLLDDGKSPDLASSRGRGNGGSDAGPAGAGEGGGQQQVQRFGRRQPKKRRGRSGQLPSEVEDEEEESDGEGRGGPGSGAAAPAPGQPGSSAGAAAQQQQDGNQEGEDAPPGRKRQRTRAGQRQRRSQGEQQQAQQQQGGEQEAPIDLVESPAQGPAPGKGASAAARDAESDGTLDIDEPDNPAGSGGRRGRAAAAGQAKRRSGQQQPQQQGGAQPAAAGSRSYDSPTAVDPKGRTVDIKWPSMSRVEAVLAAPQRQGEPQALLRFWYQNQTGTDPAAVLPFHTYSTAESVAELRHWLERHEPDFQRIHTQPDVSAIERWERAQAGRAAPGQDTTTSAGDEEVDLCSEEDDEEDGGSWISGSPDLGSRPLPPPQQQQQQGRRQGGRQPPGSAAGGSGSGGSRGGSSGDEGTERATQELEDLHLQGGAAAAGAAAGEAEVEDLTGEEDVEEQPPGKPAQQAKQRQAQPAGQQAGGGGKKGGKRKQAPAQGAAQPQPPPGKQQRKGNPKRDASAAQQKTGPAAAPAPAPAQQQQQRAAWSSPFLYESSQKAEPPLLGPAPAPFGGLAAPGQQPVSLAQRWFNHQPVPPSHHPQQQQQQQQQQHRALAELGQPAEHDPRMAAPSARTKAEVAVARRPSSQAGAEALVQEVLAAAEANLPARLDGARVRQAGRGVAASAALVREQKEREERQRLSRRGQPEVIILDP